MTFEEQIKSWQSRLTVVKQKLGYDGLVARAKEIAELESQEGFWEDPEEAGKLSAERANLQKLGTEIEELEIVLTDADFLEMLRGEHNETEQKLLGLERRALLSGDHDPAGAILSIHAGTGGTDAQDWAEMLERMFLRFIEQGKTEEAGDRPLSIDRTSWKATVLDRSNGEEAGIKSVTIEVQGSYAYGLLKGEAGVHRLVRLSPFNAKNLRQTSFALVEVIPLLEQTKDVHINEQDLEIDVFRSGGAGGQHVNTTDSAVRLTHKPTGIVVVVQNERSQHQNKAMAMKLLAAKLARLSELKSAEELAMLKGEFREGTWGNQIRSYVMQPYQMVKDHRTDCETSNIQAVLDGNLKDFIEAELIHQS